MHLSAVIFALAAASGAYAADHKVVVGDSNQLVFKPTNVNVQTGDNVIFEFQSKNHSVTQSSFASPCTPLSGGVNSGFTSVSTTSPPFPQWNITIANASAPLWFYCAQTSPAKHCNAGMVFAINPNQDKSFDAFQATAKTADVSVPSPSATTPSNSSVSPVPSGASSGSSGASSGSPSGTPSSQSTNRSTASAAAPSTTNGAARMGVSASGVLAIAGLVTGLML